MGALRGAGQVVIGSHRYRDEYRSQISKWYDPAAHFSIILLLAAGAIYAAARGIIALTMIGVIVLVVAAVFFNLLEWSYHRFVEHKPRKPFTDSYRRHVFGHHRFFNRADKLIGSRVDCRVVIFPPYAVVVVGGVAALTSIPALVVAGGDGARLWFITVVAMYVIYELMHLLCHVRSSRLVDRIPLVNTIRRHHLAHHDESLMAKWNFNLTVPASDWLFGTSDLRGSLFRHLFNGRRTDGVVIVPETNRSEPKPKPMWADPHQQQRSTMGALVTGLVAMVELALLFGTAPVTLTICAFFAAPLAVYSWLARL
jgi:hypothetical protein